MKVKWKASPATLMFVSYLAKLNDNDIFSIQTIAVSIFYCHQVTRWHETQLQMKSAL